MIYVKVPMIGSGTRDDSYRVELPNYVMVDADYVGMTAVVDVDGKDVPSFIKPGDRGVFTPIKGKPVLTDLQPDDVARWLDHLRKRFRDHPLTFKTDTAK